MSAALEQPRFALPGGHELRPLTPADSRELWEVIERNRDELARWLAWAQASTEQDTLASIERMRAAEADGMALPRAIAVDGRIVGSVGLPRIDRANNHAEIGYWLDGAHHGRGLVTAGVAVLVQYAFDGLRQRRVEIHTDVRNRRARAVPERLGFRYEGTLRQAYRITDDRYSDDAVYGLLASDPQRQALDRDHGLGGATR